MRRYLSLLLGLLCSWPGLRAGAQAFDLVGPKVDVHVKRGDVTLPIGQVPNLLPGDRLWVHPDFPDSQSARYVLVIAFLRGATNPPPREWFTRVETWTPAVREEGVFVTVPSEAEEALLFLAPATGGDFTTLRDTVRGRPGIFVRAAQDLQAASWDRVRLDAFLAEVKVTSQTDPRQLKDRVEATARSLGIKVNQDCFERPVEQQASCLSQHTEGLVMDDANAQNRVAQITGGNTADLMNQLSYSAMGGGGVYSPYVGAIVDTVKILSSLRTAHYQYIPALSLPSADTLNLRLSVPPSFNDPKSVVVLALPNVRPAALPPLHPIDTGGRFCAQQPGLVLPADGAPLVLATEMAHDLFLHIDSKAGPQNIPIRAAASSGGMLLDHPVPVLPEEEVTGVIRGRWGFDEWEGPRYRLHSVQAHLWNVAPGDRTALVVGREDIVHLEGGSSLCVDRMRMVTAGGTAVPVSWRSPRPESLVATLPMSGAAPGPVKIEIHQYGLVEPDAVTLDAYIEAGSLDRLELSSGDAEAVLTGTRLDEVARVSLNGVTWAPAALARVADADRLTMTADRSTASLVPGQPYLAGVVLHDGRQMQVHVTVAPQRPQVSLLSRGTQEEASATSATPVRLTSPDDLAVERRLIFFLRSRVPSAFPRDEKIEVAAADGSFRTTLSLADGTLMLEDANTAIGAVEPLAKFGPSAFGPIQARPVSAGGIAGDWIPLGTLVRTPGFRELRCPRSPSRPCTLSGTNLFLATAISASPSFDNPVDIPQDLTGNLVVAPRPVGGSLYVKLRDDPATVQTLSLPVLPSSARSPGQPPEPAETSPETEHEAGQPAAASAPQPGPGPAAAHH